MDHQPISMVEDLKNDHRIAEELSNREYGWTSSKIIGIDAVGEQKNRFHTSLVFTPIIRW